MLHFSLNNDVSKFVLLLKKINKNENTKKRLQESTNKELHKKKKLHSQFHFVKYFFRKDVTKQESKGEKMGNTTLIEYAIWFFKKTKREKETTDEQMYEQKDIKRERMRVKKDKLKSFFKSEIAVQNNRVQEEGDQENKKIKRKGNEKGGECQTWWTKTRSDEKRREEKLVTKKNTKKFERDSVFRIRKSSWKRRIKRRQS